jgi:hypothetical protein
MNVLLRVEGYRQGWNVGSEEELVSVLSMRDASGGADLWLSRGQAEFPKLAMQIGSALGNATFFPEDGHPGFRCIGGKGLPKDGITKLIFQGCDPGDGEEVPNEFVLGFEELLSLAKFFFRTGGMSPSESWLEL